MDVVLIGMRAPDEQMGHGEVRDQVFMLGFVDNVYKSKVTDGDRVERAIKVRGRDATMLFIEDHIANAPELATDKGLREVIGEAATQFLDYVRGMVQDMGGKAKNVFQDAYPPEALYWILTNAPTIQLTLDYFGEQKKAKDIFIPLLACRKEDKVFDEKLNQYAGAMINYMRAITDDLFYELWIDTLPPDGVFNKTAQVRPVLILRPRPYDHRWEKDSEGSAIRRDGFLLDPENPKELQDLTLPTWEDLPVLMEIPEANIINKGLGVAQDEVFSLYKVIGSKDVIATSTLGRLGIYFPLIDSHMVKAFGMREFVGSSRMLPQPLDYPKETEPLGLADEDFEATNEGFGVVNVLDKKLGTANYDKIVGHLNRREWGYVHKKDAAEFLTKVKRDRLWRWNRYNHILESGTLTVKGCNARVGTKISLPDEWTRGIVLDTDRNRQPHRGMEFYCVTVEQSYAFGSPWTTGLSLTRGHNPGELEAYARARRFNQRAGQDNGVFLGETVKL